eukprot:PhM_4_TR1068/c0_g1_i1/m.83396
MPRSSVLRDHTSVLFPDSTAPDALSAETGGRRQYPDRQDHVRWEANDAAQRQERLHRKHIDPVAATANSQYLSERQLGLKGGKKMITPRGAGEGRAATPRPESAGAMARKKTGRTPEATNTSARTEGVVGYHTVGTATTYSLSTRPVGKLRTHTEDTIRHSLDEVEQRRVDRRVNRLAKGKELVQAAIAARCDSVHHRGKLTVPSRGPLDPPFAENLATPNSPPKVRAHTPAGTATSLREHREQSTAVGYCNGKFSRVQRYARFDKYRDTSLW